MKEHLEAEESELFEVKGVLQAKVGCVSMCVHDTLCNSYATCVCVPLKPVRSCQGWSLLVVCVCFLYVVVVVVCVWWSETM